MTGTGESLADTHTEAGGALWGSPSCDTILFLLPDRRPAARGGGGEGSKDTPLLGWRETREREPTPDTPHPTPNHKHVTLKQSRSPMTME